MGRYFGTDGVRGVANTQLTFELAYRLGRSACDALQEQKQRPLFVVGADTRISGDMLKYALCGGIMASGGDVIDLGVIPTPAVAVLIRLYNADAGAVISASHNPYYDNGIKFFDCNGLKLADEIEEEIENTLFDLSAADALPSGTAVGKLLYEGSAQDLYISYLQEKIPKIDLTGKKIVIDCANGATYDIAPRVFASYGGEIIVINHSPNGININDECGSTHLAALKKAVKDNKADFGFAFDGDGDRMLAVDEYSNEVDGDMIMYLFAIYLSRLDRLTNDAVVATVMSNLGLGIALEKNNIKLYRTDVGDRYVIKEMLQSDCVIGGEQSGHIINRNVNTTGDGIASAMLLCKIITESKLTLSELLNGFKKYPQVLVNVKVTPETKLNYTQSDEVKAHYEMLNKKYQKTGRLLLRHSGTEPLVRIMMEGENEEEIKKDAEALAIVIDRISH